MTDITITVPIAGICGGMIFAYRQLERWADRRRRNVTGSDMEERFEDRLQRVESRFESRTSGLDRRLSRVEGKLGIGV